MNDAKQNHEANDHNHSTLVNQLLVLVLNDDPEFLSFYKEHLEKENGMAIFESDNQPKAMELFYQLYPDYVIINVNLIAEDGIHVLDGLVQLCQDNHVPILISLDKDDLELRHACIALADDVISSRVEPVELVTRVIRNLKKRNRILDQILIDPMTGINNYKSLQQEIEHQLNDLKRSHEPFSMVYVQVDDLPDVQETYGYAIGHQLVKELGKFIQNSIRPSDSLYRFHREGFVLVLPKTVKEDAMKLLYRLIERFAKLRFQTTAGEICGTFSARVLDFMDPLQTVEQCLTLMPFPKDQAVADRKACVMDGTADFTSITLRKLKVGIIDDDRLIREMLKHQLEDIADQDFEIEIRAYPDGEEFFNDPWHRQNERFLLIIDRIMPKMDGLEVLQKIRTQYDRRRYLCMMLTSRDSEEEISMAIQRGANDYMIKPFSIKELRARIRRLIRGTR
ncbi:response regulator [Paenibacillus sp. Soil787]|uniref:response regulator n=1 Tax=Paenibacillus sp. Soil787 TaxID=1736411 RepID=UPI000702C2AF|nr:response regulator [Paenibacillus sp. Soil787]KRF29326.1 hypothetical protein ASG93_28290 [Paenibacillus sp. Soil787]